MTLTFTPWQELGPDGFYTERSTTQPLPTRVYHRWAKTGPGTTQEEVSVCGAIHKFWCHSGQDRKIVIDFASKKAIKAATGKPWWAQSKKEA